MTCGGLSGVRGTECTWGLSLEKKKSVFVVSAELNLHVNVEARGPKRCLPQLIYILF